MPGELTEEAKKLNISDRILLVEEIWDTIAEENQAFELTGAQSVIDFFIPQESSLFEFGVLSPGLPRDERDLIVHKHDSSNWH